MDESRAYFWENNFPKILKLLQKRDWILKKLISQKKDLEIQKKKFCLRSHFETVDKREKFGVGEVVALEEFD